MIAAGPPPPPLPFFLGAFFRLPILTAAPPSGRLVTGPGACLLFRRREFSAAFVAVNGIVDGAGAGVVLLRLR